MNLNKEIMGRIRNLILFTVAAAAAAVNYQKLFSLLGDCVRLISPLLLGGVIAFLLNVPMRAVEKHVLPGKERRWRRPVSLTLTLVLVFGVLLVILFVVLPELFHTMMGLKKSIPEFLEKVKGAAEEFFAQNPRMESYIQEVEIDWERLVRELMSYLSKGAGTMLNTAFSIVSGVADFFIGFVFALYILLQKETLVRQTRKLLKAFLPEPAYEWVLKTAALTEKTFSSFLAGQCLEAVILGSMFFVALTLLRLPYALLIGVLIGFTALIPIFGAFIGCVAGAFLMLMAAPMDALVFIIVFFILQQIEGNLIYPHVVGGSVGLPSLWVLAAVTVGGAAMGVVGMLIFIPLCSVAYSLLRETVNKRLADQRL